MQRLTKTMLVLWALLSVYAHGDVPERIITEPLSVVQYEDAILVYVHGFDLARTQFPDLALHYRYILADGKVGPAKTLDLTEAWEKPAIILRKDPVEYAGMLLSVRSGSEIFFRRLYTFNGTLNPSTLIPTTAQNAFIEPGQFLESVPTIPLPDLPNLSTVVIGPAERTNDVEAASLQVKSEINYPQISAGNLGALTRQTDFPDDPEKRSLYVPLKSQLYHQDTGLPSTIAHYLCEVPLDAAWLNGTEDLALNLNSSDIKVHRTDMEWYGRNVLGEGNQGLGQLSGTMSIDTEGNIYYSYTAPSDVVRFNIATAAFEIPPVDLLALSNTYLPSEDDILANGDTVTKHGKWATYRMIEAMNHANPPRMIYARTTSRQYTNLLGYEWAALFTLPQGDWSDPVAFTDNFRLLVSSWPSAEYSLYDTLPVSGGPNRRIQLFDTRGNSVYAKPYPGSEGGPWRLDISSTNTVERFGTPETWPEFDEYKSKPNEVKPFNAVFLIDWSTYGLLSMDRNQLYKVLTGTNSTTRSGLIEINYDVISYMLENTNQFASILANIGGPSLAPSYMSTHIPGQDGQVLGVAEYGYYLV